MPDETAPKAAAARTPGQGYELIVATPLPDEYCRLRIAAGLSAKSVEAASLGLANTLLGISVYHSGQLVGMGRIVGDGGLFFFVVDIAVEPAHQKRGLGKAIVGALVAHLRESAPQSAHVTLIADGEAHRLYAQFGFRFTAPASQGMFFTIDE